MGTDKLELVETAKKELRKDKKFMSTIDAAKKEALKKTSKEYKVKEIAKNKAHQKAIVAEDIVTYKS